MNKLPVLYIIVPCYNEEAVLPITAPMFLDKLTELIDGKAVSDESRIMFVNDGSYDATWTQISALSKQDEHFIGISQSRNRGHQNALFAGLMEAKDLCDITITIDCDGQDDMNAMNEMVKAYGEGNEIVYGVRKKRDTDTFFKRTTAQSFYKFMKRMGVETIYNHADYRLVSSRVLKEFEGFKEVNLFLRGMFPLVGFKSTTVEYDRNERLAGKSHYPFSKMMSLAINGITSLSVQPIRVITGMGLVFAGVSFIGILYAIISAIWGRVVSGWTSTMCIVCLIGGIQLISIGIIGEYVGKIYLETKGRPRYIISERTYDKEAKDAEG